MKHSRGMTLIEVLISISILAFLSIITAESIRSALSAKRKYSKELEYQSMVRDALRVIERDVNLAFHYKNVHIELYNSAKKAQIDEKNKAKNKGETKNPESKTEPPGKPNDPGAEPTTVAQPGNPAELETFQPKKQRLFTHFKGDASKMNFVSLNNSRTRANEKASDQMEVGYFLKDCKSIANKEVQSKCLWRRSASIIDDELEEGGGSFVLIEGVEEFKLRYYNLKKEEWLSSWDSEENIDSAIKNHFPAAVEATLSIKDPSGGKNTKKTFSYVLVAKVRFSNNPEAKQGNQ